MRYILITSVVAGRIGDVKCEHPLISATSQRPGEACNVRSSHLLEDGRAVCRTHLGVVVNVDRTQER